MTAHLHNNTFSISTKKDRLNHAANTIQRYKDGGMNAAKRTVNWFISSDHHKSILN
jgi:hypothetical protein